MDRLTIHLTVDVGPADAVLGRGGDIDADWSATLQGSELLFEALARLADRRGEPVGTTWFLRADRLIHAQFGDRLAIVERFEQLVARHVAHHGGPAPELGWMPQLYGSGSAAIDHDDLAQTHAKLAASGRAPCSVRMGNCYHDNRTMAALAELGIAFDSSALPGRVKMEGGWRLDWSPTPDHPFRPSRADYRQPGVPALDIIEVPLTMLPIQAPYDAVPLARYVNPAMRAELLWPGLADLVATREDLVLIVHPDEVYPARQAAGHPLIDYSIQTLMANLARLEALAQRIGRRASFRPLSEVAPPEL
ncbi:hypothetical protein [Ancylobacter amanitiformis]|uniref:Polysaccharide deacetylase n=1 Tax=Ancylobacter amanitiformis TaxID=217069 RepID=A0ABU0LWI6_9HYPH|nr:hypothetical protein [Ancylobacter amanitiformis]MDQ0513081.1 hypothetical protein [Ancylobacter amanitiformis]